MRYGREEELNQETLNSNNNHKVDLNDFMKQVRDQEKKSKRTSVYLSAAAISAFAVFGIILTL